MIRAPPRTEQTMARALLVLVAGSEFQSNYLGERML